MGLPFLVFMVVGTWMWAKVLQPKMDRQTGGGAAAGRDRAGVPAADPALDGGVVRPVDPLKKKSNMHTSGAAPPAKKRMTTLEEEYEKTQAVWQDDYTNKRVPRTPEQEAKRTH